MLPRLRQILLRERAVSHGRRDVRTGRSSRAGIAMLLVVSIVALLTVIVTEVVHTAGVRIQLAANQRDEAKAEALAQGGVHFYRLLLIASKQLEGSPMLSMLNDMLMSTGMVPVNADALWQLVPTVSTNMLRLLRVAGGDEEAALKAAKSGITDEQREASRETSRLKKPFLDFDGDFTASVVDEDSRIAVNALGSADLATLMRNPQALLLFGMMTGLREDDYLRAANIEKWELIGNLADWTDLDDNRVYQGGRESALYDKGDEPYLPKNGPYDTSEEIRLVDGWQSDEVWRRYGQHLTVYGTGRVNVNTAPNRVLRAVINAHCIPQLSEDSLGILIDFVQAFRRTPPTMGGGYFRQPQDFVQFVQANAPCSLDQNLANAIKTNSKVFRVTSKGQVGKATAEIEAVFDFDKNNRLGKVVYWRIH